MIRTRFAELKIEEDKSEQQANIISSGQLDSWITEHKEELNELTIQLEIKRRIVDLNSQLLLELQKKKIKNMVFNREEALENEIARIKMQVVYQNEMINRIRNVSSKAKESLEEEIDTLREISDTNIDIQNYMNIDLSENEAKYWKLLHRKQNLESQIRQLKNTLKM